MRVLEPHHFSQGKKRRKRRKLPVTLPVLLAVLVVAGAGAYFVREKSTQKQQHASTEQQIATAVAPVKTVTEASKPKNFTGNQFRDLYRSVSEAYPNTESFSPPPDITGNLEADNHIRRLAEARGFRLTRIPVTALVKTDEPMLKGQMDDLLQPQAHAAWLSLKEAAQKANIPLELYSAYRSPEWQRELFMERLLSRGVTIEQVISGAADNAINATFEVTAVPGYSRHHTGYAVDFWCEDGSGDFGSSICYDWLNGNNYQNIKLHGWIPSYPPDADEQGPEPEPWEYVWVGKESLFE